MKVIQRTTELPAIFCAFPWIRAGRGGFVDCDEPEDQTQVALHQQLFRGEKDPSAMDSEYSFMLALELPDEILGTTGRSGAHFSPRRYFWNLYDVNYLLEGAKPAEAIPLSEVGFDEDSLLSLAKAGDRILPYIRALEEFAGHHRGYYLKPHLEDKLKEFEGKFAGKVKLSQKRSELRDFSAGSSSAEQALSPGRKNEVLQYHGYTCFFCGKGRPEATLHVHHVIPRSWIKKISLSERLHSARENLVASCEACNLAKLDRLTRADIEFYLRQFARSNYAKNQPLIPLLKRIEELQRHD